MRNLVPAIMLSALVCVALLYLNAFQPQVLDNLRVSLGMVPADTVVSPEEARRDRTRVQMIDALLISEANKRDLTAGRPFWGAAQHMIELAMGTQAENGLVRSRDEQFYEFQYYHFDDIRGSITFEFQNNSLSCVHYWNERKTLCSPQHTSFYATEGGFPFEQLTTPDTSPAQP